MKPGSCSTRWVLWRQRVSYLIGLVDDAVEQRHGQYDGDSQQQQDDDRHAYGVRQRGVIATLCLW